MGTFGKKMIAALSGSEMPDASTTQPVTAVVIDRLQNAAADSVTGESQADTTAGKRGEEQQTTKTKRAFVRETAPYAGSPAATAIKGLSELESAMSQANVTQQATLVAYNGLIRDGIDQIDPVINPVMMRMVLGRFRLPSMITVQPTTITFNAAGTPFIGGTECKANSYDPTVLSKSIILGGPRNGGVHWPVFGYDIAVRAFSTEVGDAVVKVSCYDTTKVQSNSGLDENAVLMYDHTYHLMDVNANGKAVCALAVGDEVVKASPFSAELEEGEKIYYDGLRTDPRHRDCSAALSVSDPSDSYPDSVLTVSGINCLLTITPLIVSRESVARVLNNLDKDAAAYMGALVNLRNSETDYFNF